MQPLVSVIMPNYNAECFIKASIESVLEQSYQHWELLIIDDASTDKSIKIINSFSEEDKRIKLIHFHDNKGPAIARNKGVEMSKGKFIAFLDSDDRWFPEKIEKQLEFMLSNNYAFTFTSYFSVNEQYEDSKLISAKKTISYNDLLTSNYIGCLTAMYDVETFKKVYFPLIAKRQDWALWLKMTKNNRNAYGLTIPLGYYTRRNSSVSSNKLKLLKYNWIVYRKFENINIIKSFFYLMILILKKINK